MYSIYGINIGTAAFGLISIQNKNEWIDDFYIFFFSHRNRTIENDVNKKETKQSNERTKNKTEKLK